MFSIPILLGCSGEVVVDEVNDFASAKVISKIDKPVESNIVATYTLQFLNSNGKGVKDFTPDLSLIEGDGISSMSCTETNDSGISTCTIVSTSSGEKKFKVVDMDLSFTHMFNITVSNKFIVGLSNSATYNVTAGTYKVSSEVSGVENATQQTVGGYKVYSNVIIANEN